MARRNGSRVDEAMLRRFVRETLRDEGRRKSLMVEAVLASDELADVIFEHRVERLLLEQEGGGDMTVGSVLAAIDDKVSSMDDSLSKLIEAILQMAMEYAPDKLKNKVKDNEELQSALSQGKDAVEITGWFKKLVELAKGLKVAWEDAKKAQPDSLKKKLQHLWGKNKDAMRETFEHVKSLKDLYESNETFKKMINAAGFEKLKEFAAKGVEMAIKSIPYGSQLVAGAKMLVSISKLGGKIMSLFKKAKAADAPPQEKLAAIAKNLAKGKDQDLGEFGKILQMNDDLEAVLDDKLEAQYITWYTDQLRKVAPNTKLSELNINKLVTDWIKNNYGKQAANVGVAG